MIRTLRHSEISFDQDVYVMRQRGSLPQVLLNWGYTGILAVDAASGQRLDEISFPTGVDEFGIDAWLVSPDGSRSYLFGRERSDGALEIDHVLNRSSRIALPHDFDGPTGLIWYAPELRMRDGRGIEWCLDAGRLRKSVRDTLPAKLRRTLRLDEARAARLGVLRMNAEPPGMLVMSASEIGFASSEGDQQILVPTAPAIVDVALWRQTLLVAVDRGVTSVTRTAASGGGRTKQEVFSLPGGQRLLSLLSLSAGGIDQIYVLAAREDGTGSVLHVLSLEGDP